MMRVCKQGGRRGGAETHAPVAVCSELPQQGGAQMRNAIPKCQRKPHRFHSAPQFTTLYTREGQQPHPFPLPRDALEASNDPKPAPPAMTHTHIEKGLTSSGSSPSCGGWCLPAPSSAMALSSAPCPWNCTTMCGCGREDRRCGSSSRRVRVRGGVWVSKRARGAALEHHHVRARQRGQTLRQQQRQQQ